MSLLVADPDPDQRISLVSRLNTVDGIQASQTDSLESFYKMVSKHHFDLILIDPGLAEKKTSRFLREIRQLRGDLEFIVISNRPDYEMLMLSLKEGALDFFQKPVDEIAITRIIQSHRYRIFRARYASRVDRYITFKRVQLELPSDIGILSYVSSRIAEDIYHAGAIQPGQIYNLNLAVFEGLTNALEHGNLGISYEEKSRLIVSGSYMKHLEQRSREKPYCDRKIKIRYGINEERVNLIIKDEGEGFEARKYLADLKERVNDDYHGRGIILIKKTMDHVQFSEKGNQIQFSLERRKEDRL